MQTAEFAVAQGIDLEPAFNWWVQHMLKKRESIITIIRKQWTIYLKRCHNFGIELPKTVEKAYALDAKNNNILWADAISKEMEDIKMAFKVLPDEKPLPIGHQCV